MVGNDSGAHTIVSCWKPQTPYAICRHEHRHRQQISKYFTLVSDRFPEMGSRGFG
jgi:hypothetical protein